MAVVKPTKARRQSKKRRVHTFNKESPFVRVQREVRQDATLRRRLIRKLETSLGARVVTYFTSFEKQVEIDDDDAEMLESLLAVEHDDGDSLILMVNSPGGQALAAERIVNVCRAYSGSKYEVIVPHMAKSAATMICFGASAIHMSATAELGPVDPQVGYRDGSEQARWTSAQEYVRSYNKLMDLAAKGKGRIEPYLQQLARYDSRYVEQLLSWQELSRDISVRLLKSGMMAGKTEAQITKDIQIFISQERTSAHGRMISYQEAAECGLKIKPIDLRSAIWECIWELYVRSDWCVKHRCGKLLESSASAIQA